MPFSTIYSLRRKSIQKFVVIVAFVILFLHVTKLPRFFEDGGYEKYMSVPYDKFSWKLEINLKDVVSRIRRNQSVDVMPIKDQFPFQIALDAQNECVNFKPGDVSILLVVKSGIENLHRRTAVRSTWGRPDVIHYSEDNIINYAFVFKTIFIIGTHNNSILMSEIIYEHENHLDIIQGSFKDKYTYNTYKTILAFQWVSKHCSNADYVFFLDDDMYFSKRNLVKYLMTLDPVVQKRLYTGHVSMPYPVRVRNSKLYLSLEDYPFDRVPPNIYAGAYLMSIENVLDIAIGMNYTKMFRLDDVYLGIIATKLNINMTNNRLIASEWLGTKPIKYYEIVIAAHGISDITFLYTLHEQMNQKTGIV